MTSLIEQRPGYPSWWGRGKGLGLLGFSRQRWVNPSVDLEHRINFSSQVLSRKDFDLSSALTPFFVLAHNCEWTSFNRDTRLQPGECWCKSEILWTKKQASFITTKPYQCPEIRDYVSTSIWTQCNPQPSKSARRSLRGSQLARATTTHSKLTARPKQCSPNKRATQR